MNLRRRLILLGLILLLGISTTAIAQRGFGRRPRNFDPDTVDRGGVPVWEIDKKLQDIKA